MASIYKLNEGRSIFFDPSQPKNQKLLQNQEIEMEETPNVQSALANAYILKVADEKGKEKELDKEEVTVAQPAKEKTKKK